MEKWQRQANDQDKEWMKRHKKKSIKKKPNRKKSKEKNTIKLNPKCKCKSQPTIHEKIVRSGLDEIGIDYEFQKVVIVNKKKYILDFYIPNKRLCVEIDGFHHYHEPQRSIDKLRTARLKNNGVRVIRFTNREVEEDLHLVTCTIKHYPYQL